MPPIKDIMNSAAASAYGDASVITISQRPVPKPKKGDILVRVHASAITTADSMMRQGTPKFGRLFLGLSKPKNPYLGTGFSGQVVAVGSEMEALKAGDEVFGETGITFGANSEYVLMKDHDVILKKPKSLPHTQAAVMCDGPLTSYHFLTTIAQVRKGQRIFINGGAGALGLAAIQIAAAMDCEVTASASPKNHQHLKELGAHRVVDYKAADFLASHDAFDVIFDTVGKMCPKESMHFLNSQGLFMTPVLGLNILGHMLKTSIFKSQKRTAFAAVGMMKPPLLKKYIANLLDMIEKGHLKIPIEETFALGDVVKAHMKIDTGEKKGNYVLTIVQKEAV